MEDVLLCARRAARPRTSGSPPRSAGSTSGSSSTSSRTSARSRRRCSTCGSAAATSICVVGDPAQTIYSFAGRPSASYLPDFPTKHPGHHVGRAGPQLPLHAAGGRRRPTRLLAGTGQRGRAAARPAARPGPRSTCAEHTDEVAEAEPVAAEVAALRRGRHAAARDRRAVPDQRAVRGVRGGARPPAASPTSSAARPGSSSGPRCGRRSRCCAATAAAGEGERRRPGRSRCARCSPAWAGRPRRPPAAARPATAGSRCRRSSPRPRSSPPPSPAPTLAGFVAELDRRAARAARPGRRGRHAGDPARRQGPGVGRRLPVRHAGGRRCRSSTPTTPAAVEEERRLLYVGMTRARSTC